MMQLFQVYRRHYSNRIDQVRFWRMRIFFDSWSFRGGWEVGFFVGSNGIAAMLGFVQLKFVPWSHRDDCDCERCIPF